MTSERGLWHTVKRELGPYGRLKRIENRVDTGMPDVLYCFAGVTGFLELKEEESWPSRATTPVTVKCLTNEQVEWHKWWKSGGGKVHTLLQVSKDYLLLTPDDTKRLYQKEFPKDALINAAIVFGSRRLPTRALLRCLMTSPLPTQKRSTFSGGAVDTTVIRPRQRYA